MERPSRAPLYIGIVLVVSGWAVILLGWYQAGRQELETGQLPYVISGGFGGFGLLLSGVVAILADIVRQAETKLRRSAEELHGRMEELAEIFVAEDLDSRSRSRNVVSDARPVDRLRKRPPERRRRGSAPR